MYLSRPIFFVVHIPAQLLQYLHGLNIEVLDFLKEQLSDFWLHILHCVTPIHQFCYSGAVLVSLAPSLELLCCVATPDLVPSAELTDLVGADLFNYLQMTLRMEIRDRGEQPDLGLLNLLQVSQEPDILQS
ncbi:E4orf2 [Rhesus adenovirus 55]|nr:E4orf2 [Rhesus adenovirus 55]WUR08052.1 E4orf2 [Rhesus adenovirus 71]WUR08076.1 E4orf2 [Rhesus adenovirus 72]WUR08100.1 E4orf2 [Rhesus adenovirus 73]